MRQLNHVGIYVRSIEEASRIYERLGCTVERTVRYMAPNGMEVPIAFIPLAGGVDLELIEWPQALDDGAEPLHHICFEVEDIAAEWARLKADGVSVATAEPRQGVAARLIGFLDPEAADGVRIELAEL